MIKAKVGSTKSNLYQIRVTKFDTVTLQLQVETTETWDEPVFELLGIKPDGNAVRQTDNYTIVDKENHIVQFNLNDQFNTVEGVTEVQLLTKDNGRQSTTVFSLVVTKSLDSDILESHRNVKVLDELEKYIIEGREYISEATGLAQSTANYVQAVNTQAEANEAQRLQNESQRQSAETKRKEAEDGRKQAEVLRVQNEDARQSAEAIRIANEQTRLENESNRIERETARENKESIRQTQEQQRHNSESTRQSQEATRQSNEDNRKQAEKSRSQEETIRINNEATRKQAEDTRNSQELDRQSAESARRTSETNRNNAESTRTQNENTRQSQETSRVTNEQVRVQQEQERVNNENTRKTEEAKRVEAEELRKEAYTEATQLLEELRNFEPITENDRTDYMGNQHESLKAKNDADVDWLLGEINTVHYDGQHITATDTIEGRSKSAILKGQTLMNHFPPFNPTCWEAKNGSVMHDGYVILKANNAADFRPKPGYRNYPTLKPSTQYTYIYYVSENVGNVSIGATSGFPFSGNHTGLGVGLHKILVTTRDEIQGDYISQWFVINADDRENGYAKITMMMLIEGDWTNTELPFEEHFDGMQSVKMPVLTTTGKNLFDGILDKGYLGDSTGNVNPNGTGVHSPNYIRVKPSTNYRCSWGTKPSSSVFKVYFYDKNKAFLNITKEKSNNFTTPNECYYIRFRFYKGSSEPSDFECIQIEEGSIATSYEPFKSNILTTPEDLELRGIGDVRDELNVDTGELTERIGEIKTNNIINEITITKRYTDKLIIRLPLTLKTTTYPTNLSCPYLLCDKLKTLSFKHAYADNTEIGVYVHDTNTDYIYMCILNSNLVSNDLDGIKKYLKANPSTIQYKLLESTIKTVDLSDNHVYSYKDVTHYDCSSAEGSLVPTLSIDVPTNLSALVSRQRETISVQEDQIKLLEETNSELIISQETQDEEIVTNMLASVELFEMVLSMAPLSIDMSKSMGVNPMVEVYVTLILKGEKTIEQVPAVIRDKVQAQLDLLTK